MVVVVAMVDIIMYLLYYLYNRYKMEETHDHYYFDGKCQKKFC